MKNKIKKIDKKAIISFSISILCLIKYYIFNVYHFYSPNGSLNRLVSWTIIIPLIIIGLLCSIKILKKSLNNITVNVINIVLSLPIILILIYFTLIL